MKKKILIISYILIFFLIIQVVDINAYSGYENGVPYQTFAEDYKRRLIPTQDAYIPMASYTAFGDFKLKAPEDIYIDHNEKIYIADTGNKRIIIIEKNLENIRVIGNQVLSKPTGIYVNKENEIFVTDNEKNIIYKFNQNGDVLQEIGRPSAPMFGSQTPFRPIKIVGDSGGNIYVLSTGTYQGLIQLNYQGEFLSFFGANPTSIDFRVALLRTIFPEEVVTNFIKVTPQTMTNIDIDALNRVYTVTRGATGNAIKRLNISGINHLPSNMNDATALTAVTIGPIDNIYAIGDDGLIREYDSEGNLLFAFGGIDRTIYQRGLFNTPVGMAVDDNYNIYVIDRGKNELQVFIPTLFADTVHEAVDLYQKGDYLASKEPWERVLESNAVFDLAHRGIGLAYYKLEMYDEAIESFKLAGYKVGYSNAYWEVRNAFLMAYVPYIILGIAFIYVYSLIHKKFVAKHLNFAFVTNTRAYLNKQKTYLDFKYIFHMLKKPLDGFEGIKYNKKGSVLVASIMFALIFIWRLFNIIYEGDAFNTHEWMTFSVFQEFLSFMGPILLFIIANYLVCTINNGEGKFKDVFIATAYSLSPLLVFWPIVTIISRVLTLNEVFIYTASMTILYGWTGILVFFMVKDIHNYEVLETIKIILITLFALALMIVAIILLYSLSEQLFNFIYELITEVINRG